MAGPSSGVTQSNPTSSAVEKGHSLRKEVESLASGVLDHGETTAGGLELIPQIPPRLFKITSYSFAEPCLTIGVLWVEPTGSENAPVRKTGEIKFCVDQENRLQGDITSEPFTPTEPNP